MASAVTSTRLHRAPPVGNSFTARPQAMPPLLSKAALAANLKTNQLLAMHSFQQPGLSSSSSSSSSSSALSPPSTANPTISLSQASCKRGRKFQAFRAPPSSQAVSHSQQSMPPKPSSSSSSSSSSAAAASASASSSTKSRNVLRHSEHPHWGPQGPHPLIDPSSGKRSEIYSLTNDRYPGAPGTALAKAREAHQKAILSAKREAAKKLANKAELEHLGVKGLAKKRKSSSPYASVGNSSSRRETAAAKESNPTSREAPGSKPRGVAAAPTRPASASDHDALTVPTTSRTRRPPSRSNSPVPLTSNPPRRTGTRSSSAVPNSASDERPSSSRGGSPEGVKHSHSHHPAIASTAPFQSSPLAAHSVTPTTANQGTAERPAVIISGEHSPSGRAALKRKASSLSQGISADDLEAKDEEEGGDEEGKVAGDEGEANKRLRSERSGPPPSGAAAAANRRISPRMAHRALPGASAVPQFKVDSAENDASKSRLSALSLEGLKVAHESKVKSSAASEGDPEEAVKDTSTLEAEDYDSDVSTSTSLTATGRKSRNARAPKRLDDFHLRKSKTPHQASGQADDADANSVPESS
ncbi:hypothetical protein IE53DRAFT_227257 [Violaceomyces palustris]|uniref:Uncharacterized protein n=1 Tax=Violaceomyces palustris TaxID=1673888 RepID=A0ACD0NPX6_9BASI|nr:hypothetical protein IE53DRAFT_227257 [Violaceomyces palustris]